MVVIFAFASIGLYIFAGCFFAYETHFFTQRTAPVGIALVNSIAALGGFFGPYILGELSLTAGMYFLTALGVIGGGILASLKQSSVEDECLEEIPEVVSSISKE